VNCWLVLTAMEEATGEIAIEFKFAAALVTVRVAVPVTAPEVAMMVTAPEADPVALPLAVMLAMLESEVLH
jgi:hypothetical protein